MSWDKPYHPPRNQRLDLDLYTRAHNVCFITIQAYMHQSPFVRDDLNRLTLDTLCEEQERQNCIVFTYCLMPDHLHFLVSPGQDGISILKFTDQFKGKATNRGWTVGWRGKLWQPRYYDHIVRAEEDLRAIAEYILNNPVRKGLAERAVDWPWGGSMAPLPI
jgi:putative transposase